MQPYNPYVCRHLITRNYCKTGCSTGQVLRLSNVFFYPETTLLVINRLQAIQNHPLRSLHWLIWTFSPVEYPYCLLYSLLLHVLSIWLSQASSSVYPSFIMLMSWHQHFLGLQKIWNCLLLLPPPILAMYLNFRIHPFPWFSVRF